MSDSSNSQGGHSITSYVKVQGRYDGLVVLCELLVEGAFFRRDGGGIGSTHGHGGLGGGELVGHDVEGLGGEGGAVVERTALLRARAG